MVDGPRRHRRRLPHISDGRRLAHQERAVRRRRRQHLPRRFHAQGPADDPRSRRRCAGDLQLGTGQEACHGEGPVGHGIHQAKHGGQRRLPRRELERRLRSDHGAQRQVDRRPAAENQARRLAHGAVRRQPPRAAGARRRRHFRPIAEQGLRRAQERRQAQHHLDAVHQRQPVTSA